jgi:hypothetical protein
LIGRNRCPINASSLAGDRSRIELHIKPLIGNRVISQLKLAEIEHLRGDIAAGRTARLREFGRGGQPGDGGAHHGLAENEAIPERGRNPPPWQSHHTDGARGRTHDWSRCDPRHAAHRLPAHGSAGDAQGMGAAR